MSFENYRNRVLIKGDNNQDRILYEKTRSFDEYLQTTPSAYIVLIDDVEVKASIQDRMFNNELSEDKLILTPMGTSINVGSSIIWDLENWIVKTKENESVKGHQSCSMGKCNNILTFQTPDTTIHTIPCIITDRASVYSDGVDDTKYLSLPDGLIKIVIPNNTITNTFDLLNKKLIFDHSIDSVYKVKKVGKLLKQGLIEIIAEVQLYDPNKDNLELNISSYVEPIEALIEPEPTNPITLTITGVDRISVYDNPQTYTVNSDLEVVWSIVGATAKIQSVNGNSCVVTYVNSMQFGSNVLRCELVSDNTVFAEKSIEIVFM